MYYNVCTANYWYSDYYFINFIIVYNNMRFGNALFRITQLLIIIRFNTDTDNI